MDFNRFCAKRNIVQSILQDFIYSAHLQSPKYHASGRVFPGTLEYTPEYPVIHALPGWRTASDKVWFGGHGWNQKTPFTQTKQHSDELPIYGN